MYPPSIDSEAKTARVVIWMTEAEREEFEAHCERQGKQKSPAAREILLKELAMSKVRKRLVMQKVRERLALRD